MLIEYCGNEFALAINVATVCFKEGKFILLIENGSKIWYPQEKMVFVDDDDEELDY